MYIALIHGGTSTEQGVSTINATHIQEALQTLGHETAMLTYDDTLVAALQSRRPDLAFICVQGKGHGDGTIQGLLDFLHIPYTGSRRESATIINNKIYCQKLFASVGIDVPRHFLWTESLHQAEDGRAQFLAAMERQGMVFPCIAKAPTQGGSFGIVFVGSIADYDAIQSVFTYDDPILVEQFIAGDFYTVALLEQQGELTALPVITVIPEHKTGTFLSYTGGYTQEKAQLPAEILETMVSNAVKACHTIGAIGYARVDFILNEQTNQPIMLEVNAVPGLKQYSAFPAACAYGGIDYEHMVDALVQHGVERGVTHV